MKVLVTGASGFVGAWLVRRLKMNGVDVRVLRRKSSSQNRPDPDPDVEVAIGDVTDGPSLKSAMVGIDTVFHLAGHVGYSRAERRLMEEINVQGTRLILESCQQASVRRLVHMSSVVAVGASFDGRAPLDETSEYNLSHLDLGYFETKRHAEILVQEAAKDGRVDAVILNPSTIYGAGDASKGSRKLQVRVAQGRFPFYTSGGVSVVAVEDIVDATLTAWQKGRTGERYILSGDNVTIRELFALIAKEAGVSEPKIFLPNFLVHAMGKIGDTLERCGQKGALNSENAWSSVLFHWFDHGKATRELNFNPRPAPIAIANSVRWMRDTGLIK